MYNQIHSRAWGDKKFKQLSLFGQHLFLLLLTHPELTLTGIFELDIEDLEERYIKKISLITTKILTKYETDKMPIENISSEIFREEFQTLINFEMVRFDIEKNYIFVINRFKYLTVHLSAKIIKGVIDQLNIYSHPFIDMFKEKYKTELEPFKLFIRGAKILEDDLYDEIKIMNVKKVLGNYNRAKDYLISKGANPMKVARIIENMQTGDRS